MEADGARAFDLGSITLGHISIGYARVARLETDPGLDVALILSSA